MEKQITEDDVKESFKAGSWLWLEKHLGLFFITFVAGIILGFAFGFFLYGHPGVCLA